MDCEVEDWVKEESYDSDLQKCIASFTRQEPVKEKQAWKEKLWCGLEMGLRYFLVFKPDPKQNIGIHVRTQRRGPSNKEITFILYMQMVMHAVYVNVLERQNEYECIGYKRKYRREP